MVLIGPSRRQQDAEYVEMKDEDPDWSDQGHQEDDWQLGPYEETELRLRNDLNVKSLHVVDVVSIGTKSNPIPMKDLKDDMFLGEGKYCGHNPIISALKKDTFEVKLAKEYITTPRWALCKARQELRHQETCKDNEHEAQLHKKHCRATITSGAGADVVRTIPSEELKGLEDEDRRVIGVRFFLEVHQQFW